MQKILHRRGSTLTELIVAATLLVSSIGIVAQLTVRTGRLWQDVRHHSLALDELSNQLERLIDLDEPRRKVALSELKPSELVELALAGARLHAETVSDQEGNRIVMSIDWNRPVNSPPISLVGWIHLLPEKTGSPQGVQP